MDQRDVASALTWRLSSILEDCKRIEPALSQYLRDNDERPVISFEILRILSNAIGSYEMFQPDKMGGEFHGLSREACVIEKDPELTIRHSERPADWDFQPWLSEKLNTLQKAAKRLAENWLTDVSAVTLRKDAPMTPRDWLREGILMDFAELKAMAVVIFQEVCTDKLRIESMG